jgi:hypothetical protein
MPVESQEVTMLHYLLYKALADERTRDLVAVARRHQLVAEAIHDSRDTKSPAARLRDVAARMVFLLNGRRGARPHATVTPTLGGGSS